MYRKPRRSYPGVSEEKTRIKVCLTEFLLQGRVALCPRLLFHASIRILFLMDQQPAITQDAVYEALRECYDPELPVNIVDLGLVYGVTIVDNWVGVRMTLTTPGCGLADQIANDVRTKIKNIPGVADGDVRLVWNPPWNQSMMSDDARRKLLIQK